MIATHFGVSVLRVKKWLTDYGLTKPRNTRRIPPIPTPKSVPVASTFGLTLMEKAQLMLGDRMKECRMRGYLLDGKPCSTARIIEISGVAKDI